MMKRPTPLSAIDYDRAQGDTACLTHQEALAAAADRTARRGCRQQVRKVGPVWAIQDVR